MPNSKESQKRFPRLDQLLSSLGYGTRKDVGLYLKRGLIEVEGVNADDLSQDMRVDPATIRVEGEVLDHPTGILVLLNKPVGYACTHSETEGQTVYELIPERWNVRSPKVVSVGRLDKDTSGLLLLTDQHELVHRLTSPKNHVEKTYLATVEAPVSERAVEIFASGTLKLSGESDPCRPAKLEVLSDTEVRVTLHEGRYRQVRRMLGAVGAPVLTLHRTRFGALDLEGVGPGELKTLPVDFFKSI